MVYEDLLEKHTMIYWLCYASKEIKLLLKSVLTGFKYLSECQLSIILTINSLSLIFKISYFCRTGKFQPLHRGLIGSLIN